MPVNFNPPAAAALGAAETLLHRHAGGGELTIGLVNIMPPAAMEAAEAQFAALLGAACGPHQLRLRLFRPTDINSALPVISGAPCRYEPIENLWDSSLDGLIVTGTEPRATAMADEPCFPLLAKLVDWAAENTISAIWSCFAAHAAVFRLDGLARQPLAEKLSGVFTCSKAGDHPITAAAGPHFPVPHSRHNDLSEALLQSHGYTILSRGAGLGADTFADSFCRQQDDSLFVFFQGHPEYGRQVLLNEYYRDIKRFRAGQLKTCPRAPRNYVSAGNGEVSAGFAGAVVPALPAWDWQKSARLLYAGWLSYIAAQQCRAGAPV